MNKDERIKWLEQEVETLTKQVRWMNFLLQRGDQRVPYSSLSLVDQARWHWCKAKLDLEICKVLGRWGRSTARMAYHDLKQHEELMRTRWEKLKQRARRSEEERR